MNRTKAIKEELPLASDDEILEAVSLFETCSLPYKHWTHRAHLAVAIRYAWQYDYDTALQRIRIAISHFNNLCGHPDGYNETVTVMFLKKVFAETAGKQADSTMQEELERLSNLCTMDWLAAYYSKGLIGSERAKSHWVEPDLKRLDF
jgi:hypothetical protein